MASFPDISPTYGMRKQSKPKVRVSSLGDGYEFRALYGLPFSQDPKVYDLTFNVSEADSDIIEAFLETRVADQASFTFTPPGERLTKTGSYSQSGTVITITVTSHTLLKGDSIVIDFTTGSSTDGTYSVTSVTDTDTFTVTASSSATTSGLCTFTKLGTGTFVCDSWTKTIPYNNRTIINCSFREVFEP
jgi:phage-related protein